MPSWIKFFFNKFATLTGSWPFATVTKPRVPDSMLNDFFRSPLAPISPPPPNNDPLITPTAECVSSRRRPDHVGFIISHGIPDCCGRTESTSHVYHLERVGGEEIISSRRIRVCSHQ